MIFKSLSGLDCRYIIIYFLCTLFSFIFFLALVFVIVSLSWQVPPLLWIVTRFYYHLFYECYLYLQLTIIMVFFKYYYQYYHGVFKYYYQYYHSVFKLGTIIVFLSTFRMLSMRADRNMFFFLRYSILQYINKVTVLMSLSVHKLSTVQWFLPVWCQ